MKPGKPTILGKCGNKAIVGLPGHPGASFFVSKIFVKAIIDRLTGRKEREYFVTAVLEEAVPANQGRTVYTGVSLEETGGKTVARPVQSKSGLVGSFTRSDGYICVPRDCEGFGKGTEVKVYLF